MNGRLYRSTLLFAVVPLLLLAFTISTPASLPKPALPETFDTGAALALARGLSTTYPDRAPGTAGAGDGRPLSGASAWFERQLAGSGLQLSASSWLEDVPGQGRAELANLSAVEQGQSSEAIVVMAHRDDLGSGPGANDNASGTAVLIELARAYAQPRGAAGASVLSPHTLIFLSTDGGSFGGLGAVHFLDTSPYRRRIAAVINLDALAGTGSPRLEIAGDRALSPSATLVATAAARIAEQTGGEPAHVGLLGQLLGLGFPLTLYEQGPFVAAGIPAVTITTGGGVPPPAVGDDPQLLQVARLGQMGEATQQLLESLDGDVELAPAPASYVWDGGRTIEGWAIALLLIALLLPYAVTIVDLYALCRRNRVVFAPAVRALVSRLGFWLFVGVVFTCFRLLGFWPAGPPRPPNPQSPLVEHWPALALGSLLVVIGAGWVVARQRLAPRRHITAGEEVAGYLVALIGLLLAALLVAATSPFALVFLLPALHVWLWLPQLRIARPPVRCSLYLVGLAGPALLPISLGIRLGLGLRSVWYLVELVASGYTSTLAFALALAGAAASAQLAAAAAGRYSPYPGRAERGPRGPLRQLTRALLRSLHAGSDAARGRPAAADPYSSR